eukprot:TRINITY_DN23290_c0_g1_i1.p1 TRINITY_DN23290_c0_g1~~TRINITY_DN23290_c0_g1_i1.p1  ORF type:complete len:687 (-),score=62.32 TRINITY_DN23290_c0_g1_i1:210-1997(-)
MEFDSALRTRFGNRLLMLAVDPSNRKASSLSASSMLIQLIGARTAQEAPDEKSIVCSIFGNRRVEPWERARESELMQQASKMSVNVHFISGFLFREPEACPIFDSIGNGQHIFKAFWEGWHRGGPIRKPVPVPKRCPGASDKMIANLLRQLPEAFAYTLRSHQSAGNELAWPFPGLPPYSRRYPGQRVSKQEIDEVAAPWRPLTEEGAMEMLRRFQDDGGLGRYRGSITRDAGPNKKESRLSPYYRLGLLSMVQVYHDVDRKQAEVQKWLRRSAWRDYAYWMLRYWDELPERPMRLAYQNLQWTTNESLLNAWKKGETGFPLVDAGMRELLQTGYLQQNLRHTVGQFLVEILGISWVEGEAWFHAALADCDVAINAMMWQHQGLVGVSQWLTGVDCHPVRHARKADPDGAYVRKFCPELAQLPKQYLHAPWQAPADVLKRAGVALGKTYPKRVVADPDAEKHCFLQRLRQCRATRPDLMARGNCDTIERPKNAAGKIPSSMSCIVALTERSVKGDASHGDAQSKGNTPYPQAKGKGKGKRRMTEDDYDIASETYNSSARTITVEAHRFGEQAETQTRSHAPSSHRPCRWRKVVVT